jgi:hypothetical protein
MRLLLNRVGFELIRNGQIGTPIMTKFEDITLFLRKEGFVVLLELIYFLIVKTILVIINHHIDNAPILWRLHTRVIIFFY